MYNGGNPYCLRRREQGEHGASVPSRVGALPGQSRRRASVRLCLGKVRALLVHLALSPERPHRREALAGLLWAEFPERSARTNLRNALANLRLALGQRARPGDGAASPRFLHSTRQTIRFKGGSDYWLDQAPRSPPRSPRPMGYTPAQ
jgi:hypothetical protein